jgi:hypothetical protein
MIFHIHCTIPVILSLSYLLPFPVATRYLHTFNLILSIYWYCSLLFQTYPITSLFNSVLLYSTKCLPFLYFAVLMHPLIHSPHPISHNLCQYLITHPTTFAFLFVLPIVQVTKLHVSRS